MEWETLNSMDFVEAIETVEESVELPFTDWYRDSSGGGIVEDVKTDIRYGAMAINNLRDIPWRAKDAEVNFEAWKRRHALMRRLFPDLPEDYGEYFPGYEQSKTEASKPETPKSETVVAS